VKEDNALICSIT